MLLEVVEKIFFEKVDEKHVKVFQKLSQTSWQKLPRATLAVHPDGRLAQPGKRLLLLRGTGWRSWSGQRSGRQPRLPGLSQDGNDPT